MRPPLLLPTCCTEAVASATSPHSKVVCVGLEEVYKAASSKADANREEAESLLNLISRLDFNGYFATVRPHVASLLGPLPRMKLF